MNPTGTSISESSLKDNHISIITPFPSQLLFHMREVQRALHNQHDILYYDYDYKEDEQFLFKR